MLSPLDVTITQQGLAVPQPPEDAMLVGSGRSAEDLRPGEARAGIHPTMANSRPTRELLILSDRLRRGV